MKSGAEIRMGEQRESVEKLIRADLGERVLEISCSFSHLECVADVKVTDEPHWRRYILIENGDEPDTLRRIA